ncbi:MAG TPA: hypothetical protein VLL77_01045 [Anaerolineales bacterium]|nr:hypothetical protein [Anaerolineales bacterium]
MSRFAPALLLVAVAAAACNRSASAPPASVLETGVAATLTAAPPLPATRTPPPSATPSLTITPTETWTPSAIASGTAGPTPTITVQPLPTDDPRYGLALNLAVPDYSDDFSARYTWSEWADENVSNLWVDGRLKASDLLADPFVWWSATVPDAGAGDLYAEVDAQIQTCAGQDAAGLAVRVGGSAWNSGYLLDISCDGQYRLRKLTEGSQSILRNWTASDAIVKGPNALNRIGFLARGPQLTPFANGKPLGDAVQDPSFAYGTFALYAWAQQTPGVVVYFDNFALWRLTP